MTVTQALYNFWAGFNIPAYQETSVPDNVKFPYITYEDADGFFDDPIALHASVWYRSSSWAGATEKAKEIADYIGRGGVFISFEGGVLWIKRGSPFSQSMRELDDDMVRRKLLNITAEFIR